MRTNGSKRKKADKQGRRSYGENHREDAEPVDESMWSGEKVVSPVEPVSGGFLHRMYKVTTDCGIFAVKHLNRNIMDRAKARENYERAEMLEGLLEREGLPVVSALSVNGRKMQHMEVRLRSFWRRMKSFCSTRRWK